MIHITEYEMDSSDLKKFRQFHIIAFVDLPVLSNIIPYASAPGFLIFDVFLYNKEKIIIIISLHISHQAVCYGTQPLTIYKYIFM